MKAAAIQELEQVRVALEEAQNAAASAVQPAAKADDAGWDFDMEGAAPAPAPAADDSKLQEALKQLEAEKEKNTAAVQEVNQMRAALEEAQQAAANAVQPAAKGDDAGWDFDMEDAAPAPAPVTMPAGTLTWKTLH